METKAQETTKKKWVFSHRLQRGGVRESQRHFTAIESVDDGVQEPIDEVRSHGQVHVVDTERLEEQSVSLLGSVLGVCANPSKMNEKGEEKRARHVRVSEGTRQRK